MTYRLLARSGREHGTRPAFRFSTRIVTTTYRSRDARWRSGPRHRPPGFVQVILHGSARVGGAFIDEIISGLLAGEWRGD
jgi:hypothetical protein